MTTDAISEKVRSMVESTLESSGLEITVDDDLSLIDGGLLDSMSIVTLVQNLQREFDIDIDMSDITISNFDTITALTQYVGERKSEG